MLQNHAKLFSTQTHTVWHFMVRVFGALRCSGFVGWPGPCSGRHTGDGLETHTWVRRRNRSPIDKDLFQDLGRESNWSEIARESDIQLLVAQRHSAPACSCQSRSRHLGTLWSAYVFHSRRGTESLATATQVLAGSTAVTGGLEFLPVAAPEEPMCNGQVEAWDALAVKGPRFRTRKQPLAGDVTIPRPLCQVKKM